MFYSPIDCRYRLLFALRPPLVLARQIVSASAWLDGDLLDAERLHISLLILDDMVDVPSALIEILRGIGGGVNAAPFSITLDRLVISGGWAALRPRALIPPLHDLYDQIARLARSMGVPERRDHQFNPHMTLGYRAAAIGNQCVRPVSWTAGELLLIHSHLGETKHDVRGRWTLTGTDPQLSLL